MQIREGIEVRISWLTAWRIGQSAAAKSTGLSNIPILLGGLFLLLGSTALCQTLSSDLSASSVLRNAVNAELRAQSNDHTHWMYQVKTNNSGQEEVKLVVQTKEGEVDRLQSINGQRITAEQQQREQERIENLLHAPDKQKKRQRAQSEDAEQTERMFKLLPDALTVRYGERRGDLVELLFEPNPDYHAWSREATVFHEMEGRIWINTRANRLAEIEGHLRRTVKFGAGFLGYLEKGGEFNVRQAEVTPGHWEVTLLHVNMHGKILFMKTISEQQHEIRSDYRQVPSDLSLAQGAEELQKECTIESERNKSAPGGRKATDLAIAAKRQHQ
jgi:hypothetical protein